MAGGVGARFWPASREKRPKQFLDIVDSGRTLIQMTYDRAAKIVPVENILIVSNAAYENLILEQLPALTKSQLLLEPSRNNTGPCVAYTALHLEAIDPEAVFAVLPSDHIIKKEEEYIRCLNRAFDHASNNNDIVTLGITPERPDTGYGYINFEKNDQEDLFKVLSFKEKPDTETAQSYLDDGRYLWNAGMFIWSTKTILSAFKTNANDILQVLCQHTNKFGSSEEQEYVNNVYPNTPSISVDYAILEPADNVVTIPADIGWSDIGTWNSLYEFLDQDDDGNVNQADESKIIETTGSLIRVSNKEKVIVAKGLKDFIIIDDDDALLIYPRDSEQEIKQIRSDLSGGKYS